jgi:predicted phosphodiesterase
MTAPVVTDLGTLEGPLLVFGGVYGNLEAFEALLERAQELGFTPQRMVHTGDVAAYCADTFACAQMLRDLGCPTIRGNVEQQLASDAGDCGCGFDEGSECDALSKRWFTRATAEVTPDLRTWMQTMPDQLRFTMNGVRFHVVHGSIHDVSCFMFGSLPDETFASELGATDGECIIAGHTGVPFTRRIGARLWHNSGALGMPANDGTRRVWYSIVSPVGDGISAEVRALDYDATAAAQKLRDVSLPEEYARGLETGLWPNTHHMPDAEASSTGQPMHASTVIWSPLRDAAE